MSTPAALPFSPLTSEELTGRYRSAAIESAAALDVWTRCTHLIERPDYAITRAADAMAYLDAASVRLGVRT